MRRGLRPLEYLRVQALAVTKGTGLVPGEGHGRKAAARRLTKPQQTRAARGGREAASNSGSWR